MDKAIQPRLADVEALLPQSFPHWKEKASVEMVKNIIKIKMDH